MHICKNDSKKSYKGTEPSPKGLGWCAHGEQVGTVRQGRDRHLWVVKMVRNGRKRWMKKQSSTSKTTPKTTKLTPKITTKTTSKTTRTKKKRVSNPRVSDVPKDEKDEKDEWNALNMYLQNKYITEQDEENINTYFRKMPTLRTHFTPLFIQKIATLSKTTQKSKYNEKNKTKPIHISTLKTNNHVIDIENSVSLDNQSDDHVVIPMESGQYNVYITDFVKGMASMMVIIEKKCTIQELTLEKHSENFGCEGFIHIGNTENMKHNHMETILEYDLHGRQVYGTFPVYLGKTKQQKQQKQQKTVCVVIPFLMFFTE